MKLLSLFLVFVLTSLCTTGKTITFDFEDPKQINNLIFQMDAPLESINGSADGISGEVFFDPSAPSETTGEIIVDAASLHVGNSLLKKHIHSKDWMSVEEYPTIKFSLTRLANVKKEGMHHIAQAIGKMSIRNVTMKMKVPVKLTFLQGMLEKRNRVPGDLLIIRSEFSVKRDDFNIRKGENLEKVANEISISLNIAGAAPLGK